MAKKFPWKCLRSRFSDDGIAVTSKRSCFRNNAGYFKSVADPPMSLAQKSLDLLMALKSPFPVRYQMKEVNH
jgi:hypothetical protein